MINNENDKILIDEKEYKDLIFKPIVDEIFLKNNELNNGKSKNSRDYNYDALNININMDKYYKSSDMTSNNIGNNTTNLNKDKTKRDNKNVESNICEINKNDKILDFNKLSKEEENN